MDVVSGARGTVERTVTDDDTAAALGSGDLPVLGTPRLLAWLEAATCAALADGLAEDESSVGVRVDVEHLAASGVGERVAATATVTEVDGRRVVLDVEARDGADRVVARGTVERVVVDAARFLRRVAPPDGSR